MERLAEEWRAVVGWEGFYEVSSWGRVRNLDRRVPSKNGGFRTVRGGLRTLGIDRGGYARAALQVGDRANKMLIHRLVALAFIPNPDNLPQVNHIDGNKLNASVDNLEWCTSKHNVQHSWSTGLSKVNENPRRGEHLHSAKLTEEQVRSIRKERADGAQIVPLGAKYGVNNSTISSICSRKKWKHVI